MSLISDLEQTIKDAVAVGLDVAKTVHNYNCNVYSPQNTDSIYNNVGQNFSYDLNVPTITGVLFLFNKILVERTIRNGGRIDNFELDDIKIIDSQQQLQKDQLVEAFLTPSKKVYFRVRDIRGPIVGSDNPVFYEHLLIPYT